jgi:hypothetical protein
MSRQTWGLNIVGYSSPSVAQQRLYKQRFPDEWADAVEQKHKEHSERMQAYRRLQESREQGESTLNQSPPSDPRCEPIVIANIITTGSKFNRLRGNPLRLGGG